MKLPTSFIPSKFHIAEYNFLCETLFCSGMSQTNNQLGGGLVSNNLVEYEENGKHYEFNIRRYKDDDITRIAIVSNDEQECVTVLIHDGTHEAILNNMTYMDNCARQGLKRPGGGSLLLRVIYKYLTDRKSDLKIDKLVLSDYSFLHCEKCGHSLKLSRLKMLLDGETWYTKFGFRPWDQETHKQDLKLLKAYNLNKQIAKDLTVNDIDLHNIIKTINKTERKISYDLKSVVSIAKNHTKLASFIKELMKQKEKYCCLVEYILAEIYNPMPPKVPLMYDMYKKPFYLKLL
jgi:hypothetical protein